MKRTTYDGSTTKCVSVERLKDGIAFKIEDPAVSGLGVVLSRAAARELALQLSAMTKPESRTSD